MPTLTNLRVDRASLPVSGQTFVWCSQDHGFGVRLNASGTRTFVVQGRVDGRERRVSIGRRGVFTVDQARDRAHEILRSMRMGIDPVAKEEKQAHMAVALRLTWTMVVAAILHSLLEPAIPYLRLTTGVGPVPLAP